MSTTTIHIKTDVKTRDEARKVAEDFGFTLTSLVNALLKQIARNKRLTLSMDEEPTPYMIEALKLAEEAEKAGRMTSFTSGEDALAYVRSLIDERKKHRHAGD
jgi:addiction module RelB/DinJ family antitoxin